MHRSGQSLPQPSGHKAFYPLLPPIKIDKALNQLLLDANIALSLDATGGLLPNVGHLCYVYS